MLDTIYIAMYKLKYINGRNTLGIPQITLSHLSFIAFNHSATSDIYGAKINTLFYSHLLRLI